MSLWITGHALLTAAGEGVPGTGVAWPWVTTARGARGALWGGKASELCPAVSPKIEQRDRACAHALLVVHRLLERWGGSGAPDRTAVILGTALGCAPVNDAFHRGMVIQGAQRASPVLFGYTVPSAPVGEVASAFGFRGHPAVVMAGACSGLLAVAEARRALLLGRADVALVIAGDVLSMDRRELLHDQGAPAPVEATVALRIEKAPRQGRRGAELRGAGAGPGRGADPPGTGAVEEEGRGWSYLGASGLVELARALEARAPGEQAFEAEERGQRARVVVGFGE